MLKIRNLNSKYIFSILSIIFLFILIPLFFFKNIPLLLIIFFFIILGASLYWKSSFIIILIAISYTIPYNVDEENVESNVWWLINFIRVFIILWFIYYFFFFKKNRGILNFKILICFLILLILNIIYSIYNESISDFINILNSFIYFYFIYYIVYNEKISLKDFFYLIDVIFILTFIYSILEVFFNISPYLPLYAVDTNDLMIYEGRSKGLLGHPLILSSFLIIYQITLYFRIFLFNKIQFILFFMTFILGILTNSRTTILLMFFCLLYFFKVKKVYRNPKKLLILIVVILISSITMVFTIDSYIENTIERFHEKSLNHRQAAYGSVFNYIGDHIFGTGGNDLTKRIEKGGYAEKGLIKGFGTLDNFFLTQIGSYGIFSVFIFYFYFYFFYNLYKKRKINIKVYNCSLLLFISWIMIGISFDLNSYICILMIYATLYALLFKQLNFNKKFN